MADDKNQPMKLPPGATLVDGGTSSSGGMALPPGATLVDDGGGASATASPSIADDIKDFGKGVLKGAAHTANSIGSVLVPDWMVKAAGGTPPTEQQKQSYFAPKNTAQKIGYGAEQAGEFLLPGGAEEEAVSLVPKFKPAARIAASALSSGLVNKAQGGDFTTGAAAGAIGSGVGEGLKAAAPKIAETALGVRKLDRAYGRTPGQAIVDETVGVRPSTIEASARDKISTLTNDLEGRAAQSPPVSLKPARNVLSDARVDALERNSASRVGQIEEMQNQLGRDLATSTPQVSSLIPENVPASRGLQLKRGIGDLNKSWNPEIRTGVRPLIGNVYNALDSELDKSIPGGEELNRRISTLIPVANRAEGRDLEAGIGQRVLSRFARPTGALVGGLTGGWQGYERGGLPGAVLGGTAGLVLPEVVASPTVQMIGARTLASPIARGLFTRGLVGGGLQLNRPDDEASATQ